MKKFEFLPDPLPPHAKRRHISRKGRTGKSWKTIRRNTIGRPFVKFSK